MTESKRVHTVLRLLLPVACLLFAVLSPPANAGILEALQVQVTGHQQRLQSADTLSIATLNVAHGRGDSLNQLLVSTSRTRQNLSRIADTLAGEGIQVVALQEADSPSLWSGNFEHTTWLADRGRYGWYVQSPHARIGLGNYGTAVLSSLPMAAAFSLSFPPSPPTARKGFTLAELDWRLPQAQVALDVISIHMDFSRKSVRQEQLQELQRALARRQNPLVIMGDFNSTEIARQLMREAKENGRHLHTIGDDAPQYHSYKKTRLDWILLSDELEFIDYRTLPGVLSDHKLVTARIRLHSKANKEQP